jgi:hypothetical protein
MGGVPVTQCWASASVCENSMYRMLCANDGECASSTIGATKCKPMLDPSGNIVGICSP